MFPYKKLINSLSEFIHLARKSTHHHVKRYNNSLSYAHYPGEAPLVCGTIGQLLDDALTKYPEREAIVACEQGIRQTFHQHVTEVNQFAAGLLSLKLNIGDRIGIWCPNRYEWSVAALAASKAGLILVPLNPAYQVPEIEFCIRKLGMKALLALDRFKSQDYYQMLCTIIPELNQTKPGHKVHSKTHPYFETLMMITDTDLPGVVKYKDVLDAPNSENHQQLNQIQSKISSEQPAHILFTSGTTGVPKAVTISHYTSVNSIFQKRQRFQYDIENPNRICSPPPLFHIFGVATILSMIGNSNTMILPSVGYSAAASLKAIEKEKCNALQGTATMFVDILNHPDRKNTDCSTLKKILMGGSLCPPSLLQRIKELWNCERISTAYGSTETCGGVTLTMPDGPWDEVLHNCGPPAPHTEIKIVDEKGNLVGRGVRGEICVRGYSVMLGYWDDEEKTREVMLPDGWYRTGDIGLMTENNSLQILDRIKDMIDRGGENVYPKEIEDLLMKHPKITEAYVFGVPDERLNEEICVWVRCRPNEQMTAQDIKDFCQGQIAKFKIPRYVRFVEDFPKTSSGKVQKNEMKKRESQLN